MPRRNRSVFGAQQPEFRGGRQRHGPGRLPGPHRSQKRARDTPPPRPNSRGDPTYLLSDTPSLLRSRAALRWRPGHDPDPPHARGRTEPPARGRFWVGFYLRPSQSRFLPPSEAHWLPLLTQPTRTLLTLTVTTREFVLFSPKLHARRPISAPRAATRTRAFRQARTPAARMVWCVGVCCGHGGGGCFPDG